MCLLMYLCFRVLGMNEQEKGLGGEVGNNPFGCQKELSCEFASCQCNGERM